jgi:ligand-binding SRPBCC domain-containing protein
VTHALERTQVVPRRLDEAFAFFADPWNLEAITPPWLRFRILEAPEALEAGSLLSYRLVLVGIPLRWRTEIAAWKPPRSFTDVQLSGPYPLWEHTHRLRAARAGTEIHDHVRYRLPGGPLAALGAPVVRRWLDEIFDFRSRRLAELLGPRVEGTEAPTPN